MPHFDWTRILLLALAILLAVPPGLPLFVPDGIAHADDDDDDDGDGDDDDDRPRPRAELVLVGLSDAETARLLERGFRIARQSESALLQGQVSRVEAPPGYSAAAALELARSLAPDALAARNDLFRRFMLSRRTIAEPCRDQCEAFAVVGWRPALMQCAIDAPIGVVDTQVDTSHPSLAGAKLKTLSVRRPDRRASDPAHGTGVVSLLVGQPNSAVVGVLPQARVFAADAFHRSGSADAADTFDLVAALDWLADSGVKVINLSLSGPTNPVLERAIERANVRGMIIVAAAGNPGGATGFPAKYASVLAVSAVDVRLRPSRLSGRGDHIAFAAPGVGLIVADPEAGHRRVDGTSFAAPFVTAALAAAVGPNVTAAQASNRLVSAAVDLGAPGRDPIFGWGLVQFDVPRGC